LNITAQMYMRHLDIFVDVHKPDQPTWLVEQLWDQSKYLAPKLMPMTIFHNDIYRTWERWVNSEQHDARIKNADCDYPIILSAEGLVMDGWHRLIKLWLAGADYVMAVQFEITPKPIGSRDAIVARFNALTDALDPKSQSLR
jgi:hypothetical protein